MNSTSDDKLKYYTMMLYSRKGLCGYEKLHWTKLIEKVKSKIKSNK